MNKNSIKGHKEANDLLRDYMDKKNNYILIHYVRQNCFNDAYEKGPRVLAIVVMNADTEQTRMFSLKKSADELGVSFFEVSEKDKDNIERNMLDSFFAYVKSNKEKKRIHWNMKNNNFGFSALEERYRQLRGEPMHFEEDKTINLSVLLKKKYGTNFAKESMWNGVHTGKMYDVFAMNGIDDINILNGEQEVKEYILKNLVSLEQSAWGKVKAFHFIVERAADNALKTRGHIIKDVYGLNIRGVAQYIQDNAVLAILFSILGGIISTAICKAFGW